MQHNDIKSILPEFLEYFLPNIHDFLISWQKYQYRTILLGYFSFEMLFHTGGINKLKYLQHSDKLLLLNSRGILEEYGFLVFKYFIFIEDIHFLEECVDSFQIVCFN